MLSSMTVYTLVADTCGSEGSVKSQSNVESDHRDEKLPMTQQVMEIISDSDVRDSCDGDKSPKSDDMRTSWEVRVLFY